MKPISDLGFLVVEDHGFQKWHCCNVLRDMGARRIYSADNGQGALELLGFPGVTIDVMLCDLHMPGMDGMALIRTLSERHASTVLIIVSSAERALLASVEAMAQAYGVTVLGAIEKPVTRRKVEVLLERGETVPDAALAWESATELGAGETAEGMRRNEFETFFQPKVDVRTRTVKGAEALARWRHPRYGLVPPKSFMPALETAGLVDELTWRVARSAAAACREWRDAGLDVSVAINLAVASLEDLRFADAMTELVQGAGIEPHDVILEITESAAARELGRKLETLARLRMKGFGLSIDDYGTGYSSMQRLQRVPFTELKIDQGFVKAAVTQPSSRALVESSILIATKLGINAVAEGVESQAEWDMLLALGCPMAQGYYIAQAMEAPHFVEWARASARASA